MPADQYENNNAASRTPFTIRDNHVCIDTAPGPHLRTRMTLHQLFHLAYQENWATIECRITTSTASQRSRLLRWLTTHINNAQLCPTIRRMEEIIREHLHRRHRYKSSRGKASQRFIKIIHAHECARASKIRSILHSPDVINLHPDPAAAANLCICDKLVPPIRTQFCNFTREALQVTSNMPLPPAQECACRRHLPDCHDFVDEHVVTVNYNAIPNTSLQHLLWQGSKYRLNFDKSDILPAISLGLSTYIATECSRASAQRLSAEQMHTFREQLHRWRDAVLNRCRTNLAVSGPPAQAAMPLGARLALEQLQQHFVICPVDKTSHNLGICCKQWYLHRLSAELDSPSYTNSAESPQQILARHAAWNADRGYPHTNVLPYLYYVLKAHKSPPTGRGIAGITRLNSVNDNPAPPNAVQQTNAMPGLPQQATPQHATSTLNVPSRIQQLHDTPPHKPCCSTTPASRALSYALQGIITTLRQKDDQLYTRTGIRRCWIVQSAEEVVRDLKLNASFYHNCTPHTCDFTSMYTQLPQDRILNNVEHAIQEAHTHQRSLMRNPPEHLYMLSRGKNRGTWTLGPEPGALSVADMINHLHFIVQNTFFRASDNTTRHQLCGIPMGTNAGPEIATLTLYKDEADFIDELVDAGNLQEAKRHATNARFIDDVLSWDTLPPPRERYGLGWRETTDPDGSCTFLGIKIRKWMNGMLRLSVFDKAAEWHFSVIRYPSVYSNIPHHQPAGVFTGQLTRFWHICNNVADFKDAVTQLTLRLLLRGHAPSTLAQGWNKYVRRRHHDNHTFHCKRTRWFQRMVQWALHHPIPPPDVAVPAPAAATDTAATFAPNNDQEPPTPDSTIPEHLPRQRNVDTGQPAPVPSRKRCHPDTTPASTAARKRRPNNNPHSTGFRVCALHAVNAVLQAFSKPAFTEAGFDAIANLLDIQYMNLISHRSARAIRHADRNRNRDGYNIEVLMNAFTQHALQCSYFNRRAQSDNTPPRVDGPPTAFLVHQAQPEPGHFVALIRCGSLWQLWNNGVATPATFADLHEFHTRNYRQVCTYFKVS